MRDRRHVSLVALGSEVVLLWSVSLTPMAEQQWNASWAGAFLMNKVNIQIIKSVDSDGGGEMGELVELGFLRTPVEAIFPAVGESFYICQWSTVVPVIGKVHLVWPSCIAELGLELVDGGVGNINLEGFDTCHDEDE